MKNLDGLNILIVGVGGQGTLLASKFLGAAAALCGKDVKVSEVHGMSQRGGSVVTCVKIGKCIASPIIDEGEADVILAFEQLEAMRWLPFLKKGGTVVVNTQQMDPMPVVMGNAKYPEGLLESIREQGAQILALDALTLAEQAGSIKAVNVVLIGAMAKALGEEKELWLSTIEKTVPPKFVEMNKKAFELGYQAQ